MGLHRTGCQILPGIAPERLQPSHNLFKVPILGPIAAGVPIQVPAPGETYIGDEIDGVDVARSLLPLGEKGTDLFALKVQGESMIDAMVNDGDIVIMKRTEQASNGEMVAVWLPAGTRPRSSISTRKRTAIACSLPIRPWARSLSIKPSPWRSRAKW